MESPNQKQGYTDLNRRTQVLDVFWIDV